MWFIIKMKPSCKDGAKHLWQMIHLSRYLPHELKQVVDPVIHCNGYFGHPENVLVSMITDEQRHIRELGLRRILKARATKHGSNTNLIRQFTVPELNFDADEYFEMIDWNNSDIPEPPMIVDISVEDIKELVKSGAAAAIDFHRFLAIRKRLN